MFQYVFDLTQCMWCFSVRYDMTMARHVWSWTYRPNLNLISVRYPCDQDFIQKNPFFHVQWSLASECLCDLSSKKFRPWFGKWKGCLVPSPRHGRPSSRFIYQLWEGIYPQNLRGSYCTKNIAACFFCWTGSIFGIYVKLSRVDIRRKPPCLTTTAVAVSHFPSGLRESFGSLAWWWFCDDG